MAKLTIGIKVTQKDEHCETAVGLEVGFKSIKDAASMRENLTLAIMRAKFHSFLNECVDAAHELIGTDDIEAIKKHLDSLRVPNKSAKSTQTTNQVTH
ncbi:hypothetical protein [Shewanella halifaxensis]|uniref:hypothetical protein n=1 Tax=Shewanella halifaxensis TaxID=271098 RepID=UPI000D59BA13|nr:hypothetical protein [Shewanella halifaxensis]